MAFAVIASGVTLHLVDAAQPEVFALDSVAPVTDGLERHVVSFAPADVETSTPTTPVVTAGTAAQSRRSADGAGSSGLNAAVEAMVQRGGAPVLRDEDGVVVVADQNGSVPSIPIDGPVPAAVTEAPAQQPSTPQGAAFVRGDLVQALASAPGVRHALPLPDGTAVIAVEPGTNVAALPGVVGSEPDAVAEVFDIAPNDPSMRASWGLDNTGARIWGYSGTPGADTGAFGAWSRTRGDGAVIATVDTGYDHSNTDIAGTMWRNGGEVCGSPVDNDGNGKPGDCNGWNFYLNNADVRNDVNGTLGSDHGTAVGGAAVASLGNAFGGSGLAPAATNMTLVAGSGRTISMSYAAASIRYAADNGADVINLSFGSPYFSTLLRDAIRYAASKDVLVVAAAGNDGGNRDTTPYYPASYDEPNLLAVGASDHNDKKTSFSGYGQTVDLFAPGYAVLAPGFDNSTRAVFGTSIASPLAAATAALMRSIDPALTAVQLHDRIKATAEPRTALTGLAATGGRLAADAAVATVQEPVTITVNGLNALTPKTPASPTVRLQGSGSGVPAGPLSLRVALGAYQAGKVYSVAGLPIDGAGTTGQDGAVTFAPQSLDAPALTGGVDVPLGLDLPAGRYLLTAQLVSGATLVDAPRAFTFTVSDPVAVSPTRPPSGTSPAPVAPAPRTGPTPTSSPAPAPTGSAAPTAPQPGSTSPEITSPGTASPAPAPAAPLPSAPSTHTPVAPTNPAAPVPDNNRTDPTQPAPGSPTASAPAPGRRSSTAPIAPVAPAPAAPTTAPTSPSSASPAPSTGGPPPKSRPTTAPSAPSSEPVSGSGGCDTRTFAPSPSFGITSVTPSCGRLGGGDVITLNGARMPEDPVVYIGGQRASVQSSTPTSISALTPSRANAGVFEVRVIGATEYDVLSNAFTYREGDGSMPPAPAPAPSSPSGGSGTAPSDGSGPAPTSPSAPAPSSPSDGASPAPSSDGPLAGDGDTSPGTVDRSFEGLTLVDNGGRVEGFDAGLFGFAANCSATCAGIRR